MITSWTKLKEEQRSRIREKIWIDVSRFRRDVKQVLTARKWIHKFTAQITADVITDALSWRFYLQILCKYIKNFTAVFFHL